MANLLWGCFFLFPMHMCPNLAVSQTFGEISFSIHSVGGSVIVLHLPATLAKAGRWVPLGVPCPFSQVLSRRAGLQQGRGHGKRSKTKIPKLVRSCGWGGSSAGVVW